MTVFVLTGYCMCLQSAGHLDLVEYRYRYINKSFIDWNKSLMKTLAVEWFKINTWHTPGLSRYKYTRSLDAPYTRVQDFTRHNYVLKTSTTLT